MTKEILKLYSAKEISLMYNINVQKVYKMAKTGELKTVKFGKQIRFYPLTEKEGE